MNQMDVFDREHDRLADLYFTEIVQKPDWSEIAADLDAEEVAPILAALMSGREQEAKQLTANMLEAYAERMSDHWATSEALHIAGTPS